MDEERVRELKQQIMQQHGITEEELDGLLAMFNKVWEAVKAAVSQAYEIIKTIAQNCATALQPFQPQLEEIRAADEGLTLEEAIERLINQIAGDIYKRLPPPYDRADTRNGYHMARLKSYKRHSSAAIRRPRRTARSRC